MKETNLIYFETLTDVFLNAIKRKNYPLVRSIADFYYDEFKSVREKSVGDYVVYPNAYYEVVYKAVEVLSQEVDFSTKYLETKTGGSIWLLGEFSKSKVSEQTYNWIWRNLYLALSYNNEDMVLSHWERAHQYVTFSLRISEREYEHQGGQVIVTNQETVDAGLRDREKFIEFHYALGGMLLYLRKYALIDRLFKHTTSQPPNYPLLPLSMGQIFSFYNEVRDPRDIKFEWISGMYPFPGLSGMRSDGEIKKWISSYMAVLFLRQYRIHPHLITMRPLDFPQIPQDQLAIRSWIEGIPMFRSLVEEHLANPELLKVLGLSFITKEWATKNGKTYPIDFLNELETELENTYEQNAVELQVSKQKVAQFYERTSEILNATLTSFRELIRNERPAGKLDSWSITGGNMVFPKDAYGDAPQAHYMDYDTFLGNRVADNIKQGIVQTLMLKKDRTYLLEPEDLFEGVEALGIDKNYVIVALGIDLENLKRNFSIADLAQDNFKDIPIINLPGLARIRDALFIFRKECLPTLEFLELDQVLKDKYQLQPIDSTIRLYAKVLDFNKASPKVLEERLDRKSEEELRKSVLLCAFINWKVSWPSTMEMAHLRVYSKYREEGLPNSVKDIQSFKN